MGMFDYVHLRCPECGEPIEEQSKAGPCELKDYTIETAPREVLEDLDDEGIWCKHCETRLRIQLAPVIAHVATVVKDDR